MNKLIHGDCNNILKTIEDRSIDCIITDPPYGIDFVSKRQTMKRLKGGGEIKTDRLPRFTVIENDSEIPLEWLEDAYRILKQDSAIYIYCHWSKWGVLSKAVDTVGFNVKNMIVLNKSNHGMGDLTGSYAPKHELLLYATKGKHLLSKRFPDVWSVTFTINKQHPNQKPFDFIEKAIYASTVPKNTILDPFAGSGQIHLCAFKMMRKCISIEIDKKWFDLMKEKLGHIRDLQIEE